MAGRDVGSKGRLDAGEGGREKLRQVKRKEEGKETLRK